MVNRMLDRTKTALLAGHSVSVPRLADVLGMSRNAIYEAIKRGEIPATRIGRRVIVPAQVAAKLIGLEMKEAA